MTTVALVGRGVVGQRIARRLPALIPGVVVTDVDPRVRAMPAGVGVVVLAQGGPHAAVAADCIAAGLAVISVGDELEDVRALTDLDDLARSAGVPLVVGAGMSPGLTGLLARHLSDQLTACDEIHLALHGTAGPACARRHHRALRGRAVGYHDGSWIQRPSGSGRELCWFPEPVGAYDCYRAELPSPLLLYQSFPQVERISARVSANRRDRFTAWLPMLSPPHREGGVGAVRVEVRGVAADGARRTLIAGVAELVGSAAAGTAGAFAAEVVDGSIPAGVVRPGDPTVPTARILRHVERLGVRLQEFTGIASDARVRADP